MTVNLFSEGLIVIVDLLVCPAQNPKAVRVGSEFALDGFEGVLQECFWLNFECTVRFVPLSVGRMWQEHIGFILDTRTAFGDEVEDGTFSSLPDNFG